MAKLGDRVTFTAPLLHHTETVKDGKVYGGSTYCFDQYEFAAVVGRVYDAPPVPPDEAADAAAEGSRKPLVPGQLADLFLLVPGKMGQWVMGVKEGKQAGEFQVVR
jgi:hypothetical protein